MLLQGAQRQDNTSIAGGLSQLGQAFLARRAGQKADTAEDKQREMASLLMQQAMQGGDQGQASLQQLLTQNPDAALQYAMKANAPPPPPEAYTLGEGQRRYVGDQLIAEVPAAAPKPEERWEDIEAPPGMPGYYQRSTTTGQTRRVAAPPSPGININTGANGPEVGTIPQGYAVVRDPNNPSGYRMEAIPGGPAGIEAQGASTAKAALDNTFEGIMQSYVDLQQKGAIRDVEKGPIENLSAYVQTSPVGREFGKAVGSPAESLRETIEALQPSITQAIMSQPGMSARSMDSQRELEFFMKSITTPSADVWANYTTLHALDKRFGSGQLMNKMLQQGRIAPEDYNRITRSPRVNDVINRVDRKIGELFVTSDQGQLSPDEAAELEALRREMGMQ
jgi:hypothetical protein